MPTLTRKDWGLDPDIQLVSQEIAAKAINVSPETFKKKVKRGEFRAGIYHFGPRLIRVDLQALIDAHAQKEETSHRKPGRTSNFAKVVGHE